MGSNGQFFHLFLYSDVTTQISCLYLKSFEWLVGVEPVFAMSRAKRYDSAKWEKAAPK